MQKRTSAKWLMLLLMLAAFSVTFMTRFVWSPVSGTVQELLGLSNTAAGIPGGLTGLMREKIMPDGGLITSLYPNAWKTVCRTQRF